MRREVTREARRRERETLAGWQKGAVGLLILAVLVNMALFAMLGQERRAAESWQPELDKYKQMRKKYLLYPDYPQKTIKNR